MSPDDDHQEKAKERKPDGAHDGEFIKNVGTTSTSVSPGLMVLGFVNRSTILAAQLRTWRSVSSLFSGAPMGNGERVGTADPEVSGSLAGEPRWEWRAE